MECFNDKQVEQFVEYLKSMVSLFYGLTLKEFNEFEHDFVQKNSFCIYFSKRVSRRLLVDDDDYDGDDKWLLGCTRRHRDITLRSPQPTSFVRAREFCRLNVTCSPVGTAAFRFCCALAVKTVFRTSNLL